jgi:hypothetical protein
MYTDFLFGISLRLMVFSDPKSVCSLSDAFSEVMLTWMNLAQAPQQCHALRFGG